MSTSFTVDGNGHNIIRTNLDDSSGAATNTFNNNYLNFFIYDAFNERWWHNYIQNYTS